jgi:hypothetical protein
MHGAPFQAQKRCNTNSVSDSGRSYQRTLERLSKHVLVEDSRAKSFQHAVWLNEVKMMW